MLDGLIAFLLTLSLFTYFFIVGLGLLQVAPSSLSGRDKLLVAPTVGVALVLVLVFALSRLGFPVKNFGMYLSGCIFALALAVIYKIRPSYCWERFKLLGGLAFFVVAVSSWPLLLYGLDWIGLANEDWANYALGAQRLFHNGYFDELDRAAFDNGSDYSQQFWFMQVRGHRSGAELLLALCWASTGIEATKIFMPLIVSLNLGLVFIAGALVRRDQWANKKSWVLVIMLLAVNPLTVWGVGQQLISQVTGLSLLILVIIFTFRIFSPKDRLSTVIRLLPIASLAAIALLIWYPEAVPFAAVGWVVFALSNWRIASKNIFTYVWPLIIVGVCLLFAFDYTLTSLKFLILQLEAKQGVEIQDGMSVVLFPYYLKPMGLAYLSGFIPIFKMIPRDPMASAMVLAAIVLIGFIITAALKDLTRASLTSPIIVVMLVLGLTLFFKGNDFGLYKLAMFIQPFFVVIIVPHIISFWSSAKKFYIFKRSILIILGLTQLNCAVAYAYRSTGEDHGGGIEVPSGSKRKILSKTEQFFQSGDVDKELIYISTVDNVVLAKVMAFYSRGTRLIFTSRDFFDSVRTAKGGGDLTLGDEIRSSIKELNSREVAFSSLEVKFDMPPTVAAAYKGSSYKTIVPCESSIILASQCEREFRVLEADTSSLSFVHSDLGPHYYSSGVARAAFYAYERDIYTPGNFSRFGRYLLLHVQGARPGQRLKLDLSSTLQKIKHKSVLPRLRIIGQNEVVAEFVGRGSGRVLVDLPEPLQLEDGLSFYLIDFGRDGERFPNRTFMLDRMYGVNFANDYRYSNAFVRQIELVDRNGGGESNMPRELFIPESLFSSGVQYSGMYEDGWVSEESFYTLGSSQPMSTFALEGFVPQLTDSNFFTEIKIFINGKEAFAKTIGVGPFKLDVPLTDRTGKFLITVLFSGVQILPGDDQRISAAKINYVGLRN